MSHIARRTSCSGIPAAAATCTRTSGETEGVSLAPRVHRREFSSEARRRIISTSAGLRRLSLWPSIWGVILQVLEPLISLGGNGQDSWCVLQIGPARKYGEYHGDEHHPPPDLGDHALPAGSPRLAQKEYENGEALGVHLGLSPPVCGDDLPGLEGDHSESGHSELPDDHDRGHPRGHRALPDEGEEQRDDQGFVGDGIHELAETCDLVVAAGDDPVEVVGQDRGCVQNEGQETRPLERQVLRNHNRHDGDEPDQGELVGEAQAPPQHSFPVTLSRRIALAPSVSVNLAPLWPHLKVLLFFGGAPNLGNGGPEEDAQDPIRGDPRLALGAVKAHQVGQAPENGRDHAREPYAHDLIDGEVAPELDELPQWLVLELSEIPLPVDGLEHVAGGQMALLDRGLGGRRHYTAVVPAHVMYGGAVTYGPDVVVVLDLEGEVDL